MFKLKQLVLKYQCSALAYAVGSQLNFRCGIFKISFSCENKNVDAFYKGDMSAWGCTGAELFRFEARDWCFSEATVKMSSLSFLVPLLSSGTSNLHLLGLIGEGEGKKKKNQPFTNRMLYNLALPFLGNA